MDEGQQGLDFGMREGRGGNFEKGPFGPGPIEELRPWNQASEREKDRVCARPARTQTRQFFERSVADAAGPALASMLIYLFMAAILAVRPGGLFPVNR